MALVVKQNFIIEDITDVLGNKIGEIKFNPNDARIISRLTKCMKELNCYLKDIKGLGDINISTEKLQTIENFENASKDIEKLAKGFDIEEKAMNGVIEDLTSIFGKETIDIFTGGTSDVMLLMPLLEFVMPYVQQVREGKVKKYILQNDENVDVLV